MPYKNSEDAKKYREEYNRRPEVKEKKKEYNQRPEVKEHRKERSRHYNQVQKFKKRQEIGEERWYKRQLDGFNLSCIMDYVDNLNTGDLETYKHSRNHELLYLIYKRNLAYNDWLKTDINNHPLI